MMVFERYERSVCVPAQLSLYSDCALDFFPCQPSLAHTRTHTHTHLSFSSVRVSLLTLALYSISTKNTIWRGQFCIFNLFDAGPLNSKS